MMRWLLLLGAMVSEVASTLALKGALTHPALYVAVAVGYVASFTLFAAVLRRGLALGVAYGLWGACGVTATALLAAVLFGEAITAAMGVGIALIVAGICLVEFGSHVPTEPGQASLQPAGERRG